jgi:hypothetical protein
VKDVQPCAPEKPSHDDGTTYLMEVTTSKGKVELRADDYAVYKRWVSTLSHMLVMSTAVSTRIEPPCWDWDDDRPSIRPVPRQPSFQ